MYLWTINKKIILIMLYNNNAIVPYNKTEETPKDTQLIPGISGLTNLGNTCYLNAILQALAHTIPFKTYITEKMYSKSLETNIKEIDRENTLTKYMNELFECMWREICTISPQKIKDKMGLLNDIFAGNAQNDGQEVLVTLLDAIHEETKYKVTLEYNNSVETNRFIKKYQELEKEKIIKLNNKSNTQLIDAQIENLVKLNRNEYTYYCATKYLGKICI